MGRRVVTATDERTGKPLEGALVYIYTEAGGDLALLYDDDGNSIDNPAVTGPFGEAVVNLADGWYYAEYWFASRKRFVEYPFVVPKQEADSLRSDLADTDGASLIGLYGGDVKGFSDQFCTPYRFGIVNDNFASDQTAKVQEWLTFCGSNNLTPLVPNYMNVRITSAVQLVYSGWASMPRTPDIRMKMMTLRTSASTGFICGSKTTVMRSAVIELPNVQRSSVDWSGSLKSYEGGVIINNMSVCEVRLPNASGFTKPVLIVSENHYVTNCQFFGGNIYDGRYNLVIMSSVGSGGTGYVNECSFYGLNIQLTSDTLAQTGENYGIVFTYDGDTAYRGHNNNRFYNPSIQLADDEYGYTGITKSIPFWFDGAGGFNSIYSPRWEGGKGPFMYCDAKANGGNAIYAIYNKVVTAGYDGGTSNQQFRNVEVGGALGNIYRGLATYETSWSSGSLRHVVRTDGTAQATIKSPFYWRDYTTGTPSRQSTNASQIAMHRDGVLTKINGAIWLTVPTDRIKQFMFWCDAQHGNQGRFACIPFDADMSALSGTVTDATGVERYVKFEGQAQSSIYGTTVETIDADNVSSVRIVSVRDEVKFLSFAWIAGTYPLVLRQVGIVGYSNYNDASLAVVTSGVGILDAVGDAGGATVASANPGTSGKHGWFAKGEIIGNSGAASGQPTGWICTTSGALAGSYANSATLTVIGELVEAGGNIYSVHTAGVTSSTGSGPTGTALGTDYTDGTVVFRYVCPKAAFAPLANIP